MGSTSITTTIATQFKLRALNVLTVALLIVWALSPLGSQGSIRILGTALAETTTSKNMNYLNISSNAFTKYGTGDASGLFTQINALFAASLSSPASTKASDTDTWGNVKIPILETMDGTSIDDDGWMTPHVDNTSYASLIGLPFSAVPGETKTSFSIETNYWYLNCSSLRSIPNLTPCSGGNNSLTSTVRTGEIHAMELLSEARESNPVTISPNDYRHLVYCGWDNYSNGPGATGANCAMANSYVELQIACDGQACLVSRIRRSRTKQPPPSWTQLDAEVPGFAWFAVPLVSSLVTLHEALVTPFQGYLMQPDDPFNTSSIRPVHDLNPQVFALRLSQLLNTFWFSMLGANSIQGGMNNHDLYATALSSGAQIESSAATSQRSYQVISCDDDWLTVLLLSVIVLVVLNMLGITATILCTGPDLGFNISSMAKDNEYMMTPHGGSTLDASDRARLLRDRRVKYGDVAGGGRVGYIAIATTEGSSYPSPLIRMRLYE